MRIARNTQALVLVAAVVALAGCAHVGPGVDATPTARLKVDAHVGKGYTADSTRISDIADDFTPGETVYATVDMPHRDQGTVRVRWMFNGTQVQEQSMAIMESFNVYRFRFEPPPEGHPVGSYTLEVYVNDKLAETEKFKVHS
jgi:hypothetical protein